MLSLTSVSDYKIVADARKDPHIFEIRPSESGERVWVISAPTKEDKDVRRTALCESDLFQEWVTALVAAMKLHTAAANNHTKEMLRPFTKAGYMEKEGAKRKNWKRRFFVLKVCHARATRSLGHRALLCFTSNPTTSCSQSVASSCRPRYAARVQNTHVPATHLHSPTRCN